jgi:hypothetical protein
VIEPSVMGRRVNERQHIYYVQAKTLGLIKIGRADDATKRLTGLACSSPDALIVLAYEICWNSGQKEKAAHERFETDRVHGEWFRPSAALMLHIEEVAAWCSPIFLAKLQAACDAVREPGAYRPGRRKNAPRTISVNTLTNGAE